MNGKPKLYLAVCIALTLAITVGCVDGVRQAAAPQVMGGVETIANGLIANDDTSLTTGAQSIVSGLIAGALHAMYPRGA